MFLKEVFDRNGRKKKTRKEVFDRNGRKKKEVFDRSGRKKKARHADYHTSPEKVRALSRHPLICTYVMSIFNALLDATCWYINCMYIYIYI